MKSNIFSKLSLMVFAVLPLSVAAQTNTKLSFESFKIKAGETKALAVNMDNSDMDVTAIQFDMYLSDGLSVAIEGGQYVMDIARTSYVNHTIGANDLNSFYRFLIPSSNNSLFSGTSGTVATIYLTASSTFTSGTISLKNIKIVSPAEVKAEPSDILLAIQEETAIDGITVNENASSDVYDLSGRRVRSKVSSLEGLAKGIYVINGKKVVKK